MNIAGKWYPFGDDQSDDPDYKGFDKESLRAQGIPVGKARYLNDHLAELHLVLWEGDDCAESVKEASVEVVAFGPGYLCSAYVDLADWLDRSFGSKAAEIFSLISLRDRLGVMIEKREKENRPAAKASEQD